ncbi:hypothetical protein PTI98_012100 [Pleurotus ostreatus]|nr:hypothetical protein PTI98_012100 [Pleurotus ostreatus]
MPSEPLFVVTNEDPELDLADRSWIRQEPLLSLFRWIHEVDEEERAQGYADWKISVAAKILSKHQQLAERITDWLSFCLNGSSMPTEHSVNAFIDIFVLLALEKDTEARGRLNEALRECMSLPLSKSNMLVGGASDDEDDEEGDSDEEVDGMRVLETFWEAKLPVEWKAMIRTDPSLQLQVCQLWAEALQHFFDTPDKLTTSIRRGAIQALQQMRKITVTTWRQETWRTAVKESGLAKAMTTICDSGYLFSVESPHVLETYRYNVWRETLGEILLRWMPPAAIDAEEDTTEKTQADESPNNLPCTAENVLKVMCEHVETIPRVSHPCSVFFLVSQENFIHAWEVWLEGALKHRGIQTSNVNLSMLHRHLRGMNLKAFERTHEIPEVLRVILEETQALVSKNKDTEYSNFRSKKRNLEEKAVPRPKKKTPKRRRKHLELDGATYLSPLPLAAPSPASSVAPSPSPSPSPTPRPESPVDPSVPPPNLQPHHIVNSSNIPTQPLVDLPNAPLFDSEEFRMPDEFTNSCVNCNTLTEDEWCIRRFAVDELEGYEQYEGCVITTAPPEDRLPPMLVKGSKKSEEPHYYHPDDLKLRQIKARSEVYKRCTKDVTLLVNDGLLVGAVQYQAFTQETLDEMSQHKKMTDKLSSVKRGAGFRAFAWGSMKALGSRLPQGGNPASGYGPYKDMMAKEVEEIHALFGHAKVADTLVTTGQSVYSPVTKALGKHFVAHGVDPLGSAGGNLFICHNYCSPMHLDRDKTMSTCMQLGKRCKEGEWNFVFLRWGVYLDNGPNTLWLFNGNDMHGSTMPSKSTMAEAQGQRSGGSTGGHNVVAGGAAGDQVHLGNHANAPPLAYPGGLMWVVVGPGEASTGYHNSVRSIDVARASHYQRVRRQLPAVQRYWN